MSEPLFPPFDAREVFVVTWTENLPLFGWVGLMGFLVTAACGLVGNYLMLRRLALMGDAISHSVLPGLVIAFLVTGSRGTMPMFTGALAASVVTTLIIGVIHQKSRVKQDAAIGIAFSTLFAIGVVLTVAYTGQIDLDADCVLYGEIVLVPLEAMVSVGGLMLGPEPVVRMGAVLLGVLVLMAVFFKELLVSAFDPGLARSLGINAAWMHHGLMAVLSLVVVSAFESVGAILVVAMLILPGATAGFLSTRLWVIHLLSVAHAAVSSFLGVSLGVWLECSIAAAMVVAGSALFALAWVFAPREGLVARWRRGRGGKLEPGFH